MGNERVKGYWEEGGRGIISERTTSKGHGLKSLKKRGKCIELCSMHKSILNPKWFTSFISLTF